MIQLKLFLSLCGVIGGFFLSVFGWSYFDNKGRFGGFALIFLGTLIGAFGFGIWLL